MATNMRARTPRYRSFCHGCGDVPTSAYDIRAYIIHSTGEWLTLCVPCWDDVQHARPETMRLHEALEELWEHRYRVPQRMAATKVHARAGTAPH